MKAHPALFEGRSQKNEGLLFQSTIDMHILNIFLLTVDIHFQNMLLLPSSLLLCSLLLPNYEGSHSVRLCRSMHFLLNAKKSEVFIVIMKVKSKTKLKP